jgi:hypothetical protein
VASTEAERLLDTVRRLDGAVAMLVHSRMSPGGTIKGELVDAVIAAIDKVAERVKRPAIELEAVA